MTSEDNARPFFEKYMRNLAMKIDRLDSGQYADNRVDNMWIDYMCGWTHCASFTAKEDLAKVLKQLDDLQTLP